MRRTKYFNIDDESKIVHSRRTAVTKKEALEKTIKKWELILQGYFPVYGILSCGLCNVYQCHNLSAFACNPCPVFKITGYKHCDGTPACKPPKKLSEKNKMLEYMFLLTLREDYKYQCKETE